MITPASSLRPPHPEKAQISSAPLFAFPHICLFLTHECGVVLHLFEINYVCLNFFGLEVDGRDCCLLEIQAAIKRPRRVWCGVDKHGGGRLGAEWIVVHVADRISA